MYMKAVGCDHGKFCGFLTEKQAYTRATVDLTFGRVFCESKHQECRLGRRFSKPFLRLLLQSRVSLCPDGPREKDQPGP